MKLSTKFLITFGVLTLILVMSSVVAVYSFNLLSQATRTLSNDTVPVLVSTHQARQLLADLSLEVSNFTINGDERHRQRSLAYLAAICRTSQVHVEQTRIEQMVTQQDDVPFNFGDAPHDGD